MKILLSNDDGYLSAGLVALFDFCKAYSDTVYVIAPDRNCSGASSSLTLRHAIYTHQHHNSFVSVEGTPSDAVYLGLRGALPIKTFDMVISGINLGANLGDDVLYSGTLAAAIEGRYLPYPPLAISLVSKNPSDFSAVAKVLNHLLPAIKQTAEKGLFAPQMVLNLNVPDLPANAIKGIQITHLAKRQQAPDNLNKTTRLGQTAFWIGEAGQLQQDDPHSDAYAIANGYASLTPLNLDLSHQGLLEKQVLAPLAIDFTAL